MSFDFIAGIVFLVLLKFLKESVIIRVEGQTCDVISRIKAVAHTDDLLLECFSVGFIVVCRIMMGKVEQAPETGVSVNVSPVGQAVRQSTTACGAVNSVQHS